MGTTRGTNAEVLLNPEDNGLSKVQAQQVRTIFKQRILRNAVSSWNTELIELVNAALKLHLSLE